MPDDLMRDLCLDGAVPIRGFYLQFWMIRPSLFSTKSHVLKSHDFIPNEGMYVLPIV